MTNASVAVLAALMANPNGRHWGYELSQAAGVRSGVLYPLLHRLLADGWLQDHWESSSDIQGKRPPRRYYTVTEAGRQEMGQLLSKARRDARFRRPIWGAAVQRLDMVAAR